MTKASDFKKGDVVEYKGAPHIIKHIDVKSPSSRGAATLYKIRMNHVKTGQKVDESFKGDVILADVDFERRKMQFSYIDTDGYVFMDDENYEQYPLQAEIVGEDVIKFLKEEQRFLVLLPKQSAQIHF